MKAFGYGIVLLLTGLAGFAGGVFAGKTSSPVDVEHVPYDKKLEKSIEYLFTNCQKRVEHNSKTVGALLSKNREFILSYIYDNDVTAPSVSGVAEHYGSLVEATGLVISERGKDSPISSFGTVPSQKLVESTAVQDSSLWFYSTSVVEIGTRSFSIDLYREFTQKDFRDMGSELDLELMVKESESVVLTSFEDLEKIHFSESNSVFIDSVAYLSVETPLSETITVLSLLRREGMK